MKKRRQEPLDESPKTPPSYIELQAILGVSKHMGGIEATEELVELCHIEEAKSVLDIGCGIGITASYLVKKYDCEVVALDISEIMVNSAKETARTENTEKRVEFIIADAQHLPLRSNLFDSVISESVNSFIKDKQKALNEYIRVTKPEGYVGLNEAIWIKTPSPEIIEYSHNLGTEILNAKEWEELIEESKLRETVTKTNEVVPLKELIDRIKLLGPIKILRAWSKLLSLYIRNPNIRNEIKKELSVPRDSIQYMGYGIYTGKK
jgi:ubiquinone/menaquinone biosynthesis C-methylase UbiE